MEILRFTAKWCNPCKGLAATLENVTLPCPVTVIDVDDNPELAEKHMVRSVPMLIAIEDSEVISVLHGVKTQQQLQSWADSL